MKKNILICVIYLSGCVVCYIMAKKVWNADFNPTHRQYTVGDRIGNIVISGLSWFGAAFFAIDYYLWPSVDDKTPAKW